MPRIKPSERVDHNVAYDQFVARVMEIHRAADGGGSPTVDRSAFDRAWLEATERCSSQRLAVALMGDWYERERLAFQAGTSENVSALYVTETGRRIAPG